MNVEQEVEKIIERNKKVELDKAWETSFTRRLIIALMTYLIVVLFLWIIKFANPWMNALIPTLAFILSTSTLPFFKKMWLKYRK